MNERTADVAGDPAPRFLSGGGEMGAAMRAHDWSRSPLGWPGTWPLSLRTTVSLMLGSKFPMFLAWGPDLGFLYNDAYAPMLGAKEPNALGRPFATIWDDIWQDILPFVETALSGEAVWFENLPFVMHRNGYDEQTWFTFSYSPAFDDDGKVVGMFCACTETTGQVVAERSRRESEERLQLALSAGRGIGTWDWDVQADRVTADSHFARLYGVDSGKAAAGATIDEFFRAIHPDDLPRLRSAISEALRTGELFSTDYRLIQPDGSQRWVVAEGRCTLGADSAPLRFPGVTFDITDRKEAESHLRLMVNELNHRVKNSLATVQAIAAQTFRDPESFFHAKTQFTARLIALAKAHDVLTEASWSSASLREIVDTTIDPHRGGNQSRFRLAGSDVLLTPKSALALSMALHELCTNASKYGALSNDTGHVDIAWTVDKVEDGRRLRMVWIEAGGPPVTPPSRKGFGSRLIERGLAAELGGEVGIAYEPDGVVCTIDAPLYGHNE